MKNTFLGIIAISTLAVSCKKEERATYITEEAAVQQPSASKPPNASLFNQAGMQTNAAAIGTPGMNPPHGQPGHRCDIPVGQPLNSKPASQPAQNITVNSNPTNTVQIDPNAIPSAKPVKTAPGMNPPHGEPGHRCDIPVGQPLNSKPTSSPVAQSQPQPAPASVEQSLAVGEKPKINPAHGEPWHNCGIKVGDPLP